MNKPMPQRTDANKTSFLKNFQLELIKKGKIMCAGNRDNNIERVFIVLQGEVMAYANLFNLECKFSKDKLQE